MGLEYFEYPPLLGYILQTPAKPFVDISYFNRQPGWGRGSHTHEYFQYFVVTRGSITVVCDGVTRILKEGHASLIPPDYPHELYTNSGYEQIGANIDMQSNDDMFGVLGMLKKHANMPMVTENLGVVEQAGTVVQLLSNTSSIAQARACFLLGNFLLSAVESIAFGTKDRFDARISQFMDANLDANLSAADIAAYFHMSVPQLERLSRKFFGGGVIAVYNHKRLSRARILLQDENLSIGDISLQMGFFDSAHFSTFFTKRMGLSPSQYRSKHEY